MCGNKPCGPCAEKKNGCGGAKKPAKATKPSDHLLPAFLRKTR